MIVFAIVVGGLCLFVLVAMEKLIPLSNKLFSLVWSEEEIAKEKLNRVKELFINSEDTEETKLMMASIETNITAAQILRSFGVDNAKDLGRLVNGKGGWLLSRAVKVGKSRISKGR